MSNFDDFMIDEAVSLRQEIRELSKERNELRSQNDALVEALKAIFKAMDDGLLVRDVSRDHQESWALRQLPLVRTLQQAQDALAKAVQP